MTEPGQALHELARQHDFLRDRMDRCEQLADRVDAGGADIGSLLREVAALRGAFEAHNHFEEQVLRPILHTLDDIGDVRIGCMFAGHVDEHRALRHRLDGPTGELRATLSDLRAHLAAEERYWVSARALRDDDMDAEATA